mgnify:CR=1 FL=1
MGFFGKDKTKTVKMQGYKHYREQVLPRWRQIAKSYEEKGAKLTCEEFKIKRGYLYYIIKELNKMALEEEKKI